MKWEPKSRAEVLATKRAISEARLAYAQSVGDKQTVTRETAQLARIAQWERES